MREKWGKTGGQVPYRSDRYNGGSPATPFPADFTDLTSWHPSGWSPVHDRLASRRHLVGFTTLQCGVDRLVIGQETDHEFGSFVIADEARVAPAGSFNGRFVETGDCRHLPGFWH